MSKNIRTFCKRTKQQTWKAITSSSYSHITLLLATATLGLTTQQSTGSRYLTRLCTLVAYIAAIFRLLVAVYAVGIGADTTWFFCKSLHMRWLYDFCTLAQGQFKAFGALNSPALEPLSLSHHSFWWRQIWRHRSYWTVSRKLHLVITNNLPDNLPDEASPEGGGTGSASGVKQTTAVYEMTHTIRYDTGYLTCAVKSWRVASLVYHTE